MMEVNGRTSHSNEKKSLENSIPPNEQKKPADNNSQSHSVFVNHALIAWNESRQKWTGNVSQRSDRTMKDPIISWSTTYEDLLLTHDPFPEPIPLPAFFKEHPELAKNDFYITGESYAGHYIPAFAARVHQGNKAKEGIHVNLKGFAIGNGLTDPAIQYGAYADYAMDMGILTQSEHDRINRVLPLCETAIKLCGTDGTISCMAAYIVCNSIFSSIIARAGNVNYYDIRKKCEGSLCYDFSNLEKFLNQKSVRDALGVGDIEFVSCSTAVYQAMLVDWMRNLEVGIPALLEDGIKVLVYAGEYDLICNWLGNSRWVHAMEWSGKQEYAASPEVPFEVDGAEAGLLTSYGPLSFLKVHDAGHMVPMDQPKASLEMLKRWMEGSLSESTTDSRALVSSI